MTEAKQQASLISYHQSPGRINPISNNLSIIGSSLCNKFESDGERTPADSVKSQIIKNYTENENIAP